jgi:flagellar biogenesis protein FliO
MAMVKELIFSMFIPVFLQSSEAFSIEQANLIRSGSLFFPMGKMLLVLGITLGALFLVSHLAKRFNLTEVGSLAAGTPINILSTKYLGGKKSICVVEIQGERLVLGLSSEGIAFLTKLRRPEGGN